MSVSSGPTTVATAGASTSAAPASASPSAATTGTASASPSAGASAAPASVSPTAAPASASRSEAPASTPAATNSASPSADASEIAAQLGTAATRGDFEEKILLTGELKAVHARSIVAPETSIFQMRIQYLPDEGSEVKKGDPLVDFDNTALADRVQDLETQILDAETQIAAKRSELASSLMDLEIEKAQKQYDADRTAARAAIDPDVVSRKEFAERQFDKRKAAMELTEVKERIDRTKSKGQAELDVLIIDREKRERDLVSTRKDLEILSVKAPQDGLVVYEYREGSQTKWKEGDNVWPGQPVASLPDLSEMEVQFAVSEVDAPRLRVGMPVDITIDSLPERPLTGRIVDIPSMAVTRDPDSKVRIFLVRSSLSETIRGTMKPGMSVLGRVVVDRRPGSLLVPREAVRFDGEHYTIHDAASGAKNAREIHPVGRNARHYLLASAATAAAAPSAPSSASGAKAAESSESSSETGKKEKSAEKPQAPSDTKSGEGSR